MTAPLPTPLDCEIMAWMALRQSVRWANIPQHWRARIHRLADDDFEGPRWIERDAFVMVRLTTVGRQLAAAYRAGRAAAPDVEVREGSARR